MPESIKWTTEDDALIIAMRQAGADWKTISAKIGISVSTVAKHGYSINAVLPVLAKEKKRAVQAREPLSAPLPPGHALTWGVISTQKYPKVKLF